MAHNKTENQVENMIIKIWMIRHGMTEGNREQRYVGTTDEPLCEEGRQQVTQKRPDHEAKAVYVSPMLRCRETAAILYPSVDQRVIDDFRECCFGVFEYRNYRELNGNPAYQAWIDSGGIIGFPEGENQKEFCDRVQKAFEQCMMEEVIPKAQKWELERKVLGAEKEEWQAAMVVHGGTIMAILSKWAEPHFDYFHWQAKNGCGFIVSLDTKAWLAGEGRLSVIEKF